MAGTVRAPLGVKEASLRVPSMRTGPARQWSVACDLLYTLSFSQTLNAYWQNSTSTIWKHVTSRNPSDTTSQNSWVLVGLSIHIFSHEKLILALTTCLD